MRRVSISMITSESNDSEWGSVLVNSNTESIKEHYVDITTEVGTLSPEPLVMAWAADRQYAMPLAVMLRSVITNLDSRRAESAPARRRCLDRLYKISHAGPRNRHEGGP